jgi:hypothetical protein
MQEMFLSGRLAIEKIDKSAKSSSKDFTKALKV